MGLVSSLSIKLCAVQHAFRLGAEPSSARCVSGAPVLRCSGAPVLRCSGAPVLRCSGAPVLRCSGAPVLRCSGEEGRKRWPRMLPIGLNSILSKIVVLASSFALVALIVVLAWH